MNITLKFNTDNAAFKDNGFNDEMERIMIQATNLLYYQSELQTKVESYKLKDSNGNTVGSVVVEPS